MSFGLQNITTLIQSYERLHQRRPTKLFLNQADKTYLLTLPRQQIDPGDNFSIVSTGESGLLKSLSQMFKLNVNSHFKPTKVE